MGGVPFLTGFSNNRMVKELAFLRLCRLIFLLPPGKCRLNFRASSEMLQYTFVFGSCTVNKAQIAMILGRLQRGLVCGFTPWPLLMIVVYP